MGIALWQHSLVPPCRVHFPALPRSHPIPSLHTKLFPQLQIKPFLNSSSNFAFLQGPLLQLTGLHILQPCPCSVETTFDFFADIEELFIPLLCFANSAFCRVHSAESPTGPPTNPALLYSLPQLEEALKAAYKLVTEGKFTEALKVRTGGVTTRSQCVSRMPTPKCLASRPTSQGTGAPCLSSTQAHTIDSVDLSCVSFIV